ncbi:MAG: hypothetical protein PHC80_01870 [Eubacteriales bacterium]|nr:hypothetical protein [Eubacteriales bacterium]
MNTMEEKIKKSAKAVDIATKIFYIAMTVCACMIAVGIIWSLVYPAAATYQLNDRVSLASPLFNMSFRSRAHMYSWCIYTLADSCVLISILLLTNRIFHDISLSGAPFEAIYAKRIKTISILMLIDAIAVPVIFRTLVDALLHPEVVEHGVNGTLAVVAVIFLCLSYIFQYGSELQRLNDETL